MSVTADLPSVSVIIPAYNAEASMEPLLRSLQELDYPAERLQIIIIDNGSTDATREIVRRFPVTLLEERATRSSYAARNRGLRAARNEVIAFTDADCTVTPSWIREGVAALRSVDIAAGEIQFRFSPHPTAAELYDSLHHMRNDELIRKYSGAATANLFVPRTLFDRLGLFRPDIRSGGDMMWTRAATTAGFRLVYAPKAVVLHPTRGMRELMVKGFRLGTGSHALKRTEGQRAWSILGEGLRLLAPPRVGPTRRLIHSKGGPEHAAHVYGIWCAGYQYRVMRGLGLVYALFAGRGGRGKRSEPLPGNTAV